MIRLATTADAAAIATIYNHYVSSSTITFEEQMVAIDEMAQRIASVGAQLPWYVFERDGQILGYRLRNALACPERLSFFGPSQRCTWRTMESVRASADSFTVP